MIKHNVDGSKVHQGVVDYFKQCGYETKIQNGRNVGYFHSTGHGLGLDVHEDPLIGFKNDVLKKDMVVTVEPGLYYPGLGACRVEDVVAATVAENWSEDLDRQTWLETVVDSGWAAPSWSVDRGGCRAHPAGRGDIATALSSRRGVPRIAHRPRCSPSSASGWTAARRSPPVPRGAGHCRRCGAS